MMNRRQHRQSYTKIVTHPPYLMQLMHNKDVYISSTFIHRGESNINRITRKQINLQSCKMSPPENILPDGVASFPHRPIQVLGSNEGED